MTEQVVTAPPPTGRKALGALRRAKRRTPSPWWGLLLTTPALILVIGLFIIPLGLMFWMSLNNWPLLGSPTFIGVKNYTRAFTSDSTFITSLEFTLIYTIVITPILFIGGLLLAFLIRRPGRVSGFFRTIFFTPYVIGFAAASFLWLWFVDPRVGPIAAVASSLGVDLNQDNWLTEKWPAFFVVIVMVTWKVVGFHMVLLLSGLNGVPTDALEAAQIDGAGWWRRLFSIILPLMRPTVTMVLVFSISGSLLAFEQFFLITQGRPSNQTMTTVYWIYNVSFTRFQLGYGAALSVIMLALLLIVTMFQLRILRGKDDLD